MALNGNVCCDMLDGTKFVDVGFFLSRSHVPKKGIKHSPFRSPESSLEFLPLPLFGFANSGSP
jgi:hypothetical protein